MPDPASERTDGHHPSSAIPYPARRHTLRAQRLVEELPNEPRAPVHGADLRRDGSVRSGDGLLAVAGSSGLQPRQVSARDSRYRSLTGAMLENQKKGEPVHTWPVMEANEESDWSQSYQTVGQFMSTDLFTLRPDDLVDFAASIMDWRHIRHVPVENERGELVGLLTHRALLRVLSRGLHKGDEPLIVRDIMKTDPVAVTSSTSSLEAIEVMQSNHVGCLPVVDDGQLVGIVTSYDFLDASARLFKEHLTKSRDTSTKAVGAK